MQRTVDQFKDIYAEQWAGLRKLYQAIADKKGVTLREAFQGNEAPDSPHMQWVEKFVL
jgi:hypothetical protein